METSREDVGIAIRSAFLAKGTKQRFSLFALIILSIILLFVETIEAKPLNFIGSQTMVFFGPIISAFVKTDGYYRAAELFESSISVEFLISELERLGKNG